MIQNLRSMAVFAAVVEEGSFRAASEKLNLSPSVVSHHLAKLEERLGCTLLERTSRSISLTQQGAILFTAAKEMTRVASEGVEQLQGKTETFSGRFRICAPSFLIGGVMTPYLEHFLLAHPQVMLDVEYTRGVRHPVGDNFDLVLSTQKIEGQRLSSRKFVGRGFGVFAAPDLADRINALPKSQVLSKIPVLTSSSITQTDWLEMFAIHETIPAEDMVFRLKCDDMAVVYSMCLSGMGMTVLPNLLCDEDIKRGRLVRVLPDLEVKQFHFYATWQTLSQKAVLIERFVNSAQETLSQKQT